ncbi:HAD-like domain-containing protein [Mycena sp. CBHHK59/15]|nr:HAD-like domain-containing protein [Mycena sp. CBHHK59/15]
MSDLHDVQVLLFDVFGTVADWYGSLTQELEIVGEKYNISWRISYPKSRKLAQGSTGSLNVDETHRQMERILNSPEWKHLGAVFDEKERENLNSAWHRLNGWPDASEGLDALKKHFIIAALSNGNICLLVDMAKHNDLPWDAVFYAEIFNSSKPYVYLDAIKQLSLQPQGCAMVTCHAWDLRSVGMMTIYVLSAAEEPEV